MTLPNALHEAFIAGTSVSLPGSEHKHRAAGVKGNVQRLIPTRSGDEIWEPVGFCVADLGRDDWRVNGLNDGPTLGAMFGLTPEKRVSMAMIGGGHGA